MVAFAQGALVAASPNLKPVPKATAKLSPPKLGLRNWMHRVLEECDRASAGFDVDAVHDLRVALRRCRSLADGLRAIDPDPSWKEMKKAGQKLFRALGDLRDMQVMQEWIEKLSDVKPVQPADRTGESSSGDHDSSRQLSDNRFSDDVVAAKLFDHVLRREAECKQHALKDLNQFDRKQWRHWSQTLPQRAARVRPGSAVYLHLALEKWTAAYELHKHAMRTRRRCLARAAHRHQTIPLHGGEFPTQRTCVMGRRSERTAGSVGRGARSGCALGDSHRQNVRPFPDPETRRRWREKLTVERAKRIERYREKMVGPQSLWRVWRAGLPSGPQLRAAAMSRLRTWAGYLDPDFSHSQRVAQLALLLYDGLKNAATCWLRNPQLRVQTHDPRAVLQAAALMHDVGKAKG